MKSNKLELLTTKIGSGTTPRGGKSIYQDFGTYLIRSQNIYNHEFKKKGLVCIPQEIAEKMKSVEIMKNDVLINITGDSVARAYLVPDEVLPARVSQHVCILRTKTELNPHYLYYFLINPATQNYLQSISGIGGTRNALTKEMLCNLIIEYPDLPIQEKIVKQLNAIKNKIIILKNQNKILEQMAQAIFNSWFINFDGHAKFEDSKLGQIPKGWNVMSLRNLTEKFTTGLNPRKNFVLGNGNNYYVTIKNMSNNDIILDEKCDKIDDDAIRKINLRSNLEKNDILLSGVGTIGRIFFIDEKPSNWNINESIFTLRANQKTITPIILYHLLLSNDFQSYIHANASGSVQKGIRMSDIENYNFALPDIETLKEMSEVPYNILKQIKLNKKNIIVLAETRDTLLPKLMSGELIN